MSDSPTLNADELKAWRGWVEASARINQAIEQELRAESGLSFDDYEVLVGLSESPGRRLRQHELARQVVHSPSRLSQRLDRMASRGLVYREPCDDDRRAVWAVLTDEGFAALEAAYSEHVLSVRRHFLDLLDSDTLEVFARALPKLARDSADRI